MIAANIVSIPTQLIQVAVTVAKKRWIAGVMLIGVMQI